MITMIMVVMIFYRTNDKIKLFHTCKIKINVVCYAGSIEIQI